MNPAAYRDAPRRAVHVFFVLAVTAAGCMFCYKLFSFLKTIKRDELAGFAFDPILVYGFVAMGFLCLLAWAYLTGQFRDVERPKYEAFLASHARTPHPERLSWETDRVDRYNRLDWLVINRLGKRPSDTRLEDVNTFEPVPGRSAPLYERSGRSGRVDVVRKGNAFDARTRGVQQFTLLLSPDVTDFSKPVQVTVNGSRVFDGPVPRDPAVLLKWAARDDDRTMLYAAELTVGVP